MSEKKKPTNIMEALELIAKRISDMTPEQIEKMVKDANVTPEDASQYAPLERAVLQSESEDI